MNLYLAYDDQTFNEAKAESDTSNDSWKHIDELFYYLMDYGFQDLKIGGCKSFRIFNQDGKIAFESHKAPILSKGEVA